jgi:two-component system OmpR family response regulator
VEEQKHTPPRVLIVEDTEVFRTFLRLVVEGRCPGVEVREAEGVAEGYRIAMAYRPRAALIDIGLPDGNGLDLVKRLRAELPNAALAVCTMHDLPEYQEAARRCGADCFFGKQRLTAREVEGFVRGALHRAALRGPEAEGEPLATDHHPARGSGDPLEESPSAPVV